LTNSCNKCDTVICKEVKVSCYPEKCNWTNAGFGMASTSRCGTITAEANNLNNACIRYEWIVKQNGTILFTDTASSRLKTFSFDKNGVYVVCLKLVNTCKKCDTFICKEVEVKCFNTEKCNWKAAGAAASYKVDCNKVYLEAANLNNGCIKYAWSSGGAVISKSRLAYKTYSTNGNYSACLKLIDTCKQCDTTICVEFKIACQPCGATAKFTVDSIRKGTVYFTNTSTGAYSYSWNFGDTTYSKDKNPKSHTYKYSGGRKICLTVWDSLGKCSTTYCYYVQVVTGRSNQTEEINAVVSGQLKVWPNPATGILNANWTGTNSKIQITDMNGRVLIQQQTNHNNAAINISGLTEGIYLLRISGDGADLNSRFIISR
jgi:PKD repeat protein